MGGGAATAAAETVGGGAAMATAAIGGGAAATAVAVSGPRLDPPAGGGEEWRTRDLKLCPPHVLLRDFANLEIFTLQQTQPASTTPTKTENKIH